MSEPESSFEMTPAASPDQQSPISVALMFYIVTMSAIAVACLRSVASNEFATWGATAQCIAGSGALGLISGVVSGFVYRSRGLDFFLMPIAGSVVGAFAGILLLVDVQHYLEILFVAFLGSWLLIATMLLATRLQTR